MVTTSMDDYMQSMQQQNKRRFAAENIARTRVNTGSLVSAGAGGIGDNNAGLAAQNPTESEQYTDARSKQADAADTFLAAAVFNILENAAATSRGAPPGMAQAAEAAAKQQVQAITKRVKEQEEAKATMVTEIKYKKEVDKKAEEVNQRLFAATAASTKEVSEDVQKSIDDATNVYTTRSKDPSVNVVA